MSSIIGRFAPSPSGPLHFGSLVAALASYCQAKSRQGDWLLRIEDVDRPRVVKGSTAQILRDLEAFGFEWDGSLLYQSGQFSHYEAGLEQLLRDGVAYGCQCSRRSLREQGVRNGPLGQIYPGNCRAMNLPPQTNSVRLDTSAARDIKFADAVYGDFSLNISQDVGDFVLKRVDGIYAYHLAVVIDDEIQGITEVVRGADLLENTCLHIYLQRCLGYRTPEYMHIPLALNADGVKLSKQTGAVGLDHRYPARQLTAALRHLGQPTQPELDNLPASEILQLAVDSWNPALIPVANHSPSASPSS